VKTKNPGGHRGLNSWGAAKCGGDLDSLLATGANPDASTHHSLMQEYTHIEPHVNMEART
jgi:hypothetical protein